MSDHLYMAYSERVCLLISIWLLQWEKPEELTLYEQQQQKPSNQHPQVQSHPPGPSTQQAPHMQVQLQGQHQAQIHNQTRPFQQAAQSLVSFFFFNVSILDI